jgi:hypothetical protein
MEPATFWFVAQRLNHYATACPILMCIISRHILYTYKASVSKGRDKLFTLKWQPKLERSCAWPPRSWNLSCFLWLAHVTNIRAVSWFCAVCACYVNRCNIIYIYICADLGPLCISEIYQWCREPCFASAAISKVEYQQKIPMHKRLLI